MKTYVKIIDTLDAIDFIRATNNIDVNFTLKRGITCVDGKSIMGVLCICGNGVITVNAENGDIDLFNKRIERFKVTV